MKIAIDLIKVDDEVRIRREIGNLQPLVDSIGKVGLINPILIDEQSNLIAGYRRLEACKKLKMEEVEVKIVEFGGDMLKKLDVELAENFFRKDFTPHEVLASEMRRQEIIESTRKKGMFERFWLWLKSLFSADQSSIKKTYRETAPSSEKVAAKKVQDDQQEGSSIVHGTTSDEHETTQEAQIAGHTIPRQDDHSIKWRTS
ncbi:MAG: ParB N-terminal domain-containing protein [Desulfocapsaceae bacterium]|nr:ParB N-terminal domain-containing protein [Desulfocapsaceae bacterium]